MKAKVVKVRPAVPTEFDEVAAFCAGRDKDPKTREIKRRRREWLREAAGRGLTVLLALEGRVPPTLDWGGEQVRSEELTLLADGLVVGLLEYIPIEETLYPVEGEGYLFVDCLWVIPPYLGRGVGRALMKGVIQEARRQRTGVAALAWRGEEPFKEWSYMPAAFFRGFGFGAVDEDDERALMAVSYGSREKPVIVKPERGEGAGVELLTHPSCPASLWAAQQLESEEAGAGVRAIEVEGKESARQGGALFGIRVDGRVVVNRLAFRSDVARALARGDGYTSSDGS